MILNLEQMRSVTLGAVHLEQSAEGVRFHRFTPEEEAVYAERDGMYPKVFAPAGIRMDFETDAVRLQLTVSAWKKTSRSYFRFDILVDGQLRDNIRNYEGNVKNGEYPAGDYPLGSYSGEYALGSGNKRITIQFPWSVACAIKELDLTGASYIKPLPREKKLLIYGDSITQGYDALQPSRSYVVQLCDWLGMEGFNKAVGGEIYCPALAAAPSGVEPDMILTAYGVNDWYVRLPEDFENRCREFWRTICTRYPGVPKFALTPIWFLYEKDSAFGPFETLERILTEVVGEFPEVVLLRGWDFVPHDPALFGDGRLHPNDEGFDHYYENLKKAMQPFL